MIKTFDNKINIVGDDLKNSIKKDSKISVSTSLFSIYGFEINLKNELKGRTIAKECKKWIEQKAKFKTNKGNNSIQSMFIINEEQKSLYLGIDEFSSAGFGYKKDDSALRVINKIVKFNLVLSLYARESILLYLLKSIWESWLNKYLNLD